MGICPLPAFIVGDDLAKVTRAKGVEDRTLFVEVRSSAWLMELNMRKRYGEAYEAYRRSAPFLLPLPRRRGAHAMVLSTRGAVPLRPAGQYVYPVPVPGQPVGEVGADEAAATKYADSFLVHVFPRVRLSRHVPLSCRRQDEDFS